MMVWLRDDEVLCYVFTLSRCCYDEGFWQLGWDGYGLNWGWEWEWKAGVCTVR